MPGIEAPNCAECTRNCGMHSEHRLHRIYTRRQELFEAIGWECRECKRVWRDPD